MFLVDYLGGLLEMLYTFWTWAVVLVNWIVRVLAGRPHKSVVVACALTAGGLAQRCWAGGILPTALCCRRPLTAAAGSVVTNIINDVTCNVASDRQYDENIEMQV